MSVKLEDRLLSRSLTEKLLSLRNSMPFVDNFYTLYETPSDGKGIKNVTINGAGDMTFLPKGKESVLSGNADSWTTENRQTGNYGKVLRKLLVENGIKEFSNSDLEKIVNFLKGEFLIEGQFDLVQGYDIQTLYSEDSHDDGGYNLGTLEYSCMRHDGSCQDACEYYADNPDTCKLLVLRSPIDGDRIRGRALVWIDEDGVTVMDRVYANDAVTAAFKEHAKSNGWWHKTRQDSSSEHFRNPATGEDVRRTFKIKMNGSHSILPYMDSMYYVRYGNPGYCTNDQNLRHDRYAQTEPDNQDGEEESWDDIHDCAIYDRDDAVWLDYRNQTTHVENTFYCNYTGDNIYEDDAVELADGTMVWKDHEDLRHLDHLDEYYMLDQISYCDHSDMEYPMSEVDFNSDLGIHIHRDNVEDAYIAAGWVRDENEDWISPDEQEAIEEEKEEAKLQLELDLEEDVKEVKTEV